MKLQNEFTVDVPLERAWDTLLDIERVAGFLPGAKIEPAGEDGVFHGSMKVKVGPMTVNYQGTARLAAVDEQARTADIEVRAKEAKGQGTAAAVIRNRLLEESGGTRVIAETDLQVTGRQAQFGRAIMQDVAGRMLGDFARRFEAYLAGGGEETGADAAADGGAGETSAAPAEPHRAPAAAPPPPPPSEPEDALDLGSVLTQTPVVRYGVPVAAGLVLLVVLLAALRSRKRGLSVRVGIGL
jgi:carbon monoxide dehydrogenase subunit G